MSRSQRIRRRRRYRGRPANKALLTVLVLLMVAGIAGLSLVGWVVSTAASAPPLSTLKERDPGANTEVLAADGTRLGFIQAQFLSRPVAGDRFPKVLRDATVAIEDQRFYKHKGVDFEGVVRAAVKNFTSRKTVQGGSTISMQLVRNLYTADTTRSGLAGYQRKIREAKLAEDLENEHSKEWILDKYMNTVPYGTVGGQTAIGAQAAAKVYFSKNVNQLDLREAALLAGLPQAPSTYSPTRNEGAALARRNEVLRKMAELGMVSEESAQRAMRRGLGLKTSTYFTRRRESYFFDYVKDELIKEYGARQVRLGGMVVHTTVDLKKQQEARAAIAEKLAGVGPSSAVVTIDPRNGNILAMASSADYGKSKFNLAAQGHRQPGSSFKVMGLMAALRQGIDPDRTSYTSRSPTHIDEPQICGVPFDIKTYSGSGAGTLSLRRATLKSDNSVYIQLAVDIGPDKVRQAAYDLGIKTHLDAYCAEILGGLTIGVSPLEMANAYATIASGGYRNRPRAITKVEVPGHRAELPRRWRKKRVKAFSDGVAYKAAEILQQNIVSGTGGKASIGCPSSGGKTGTTDQNTDAWFVGFTPRLATAVWVGYPKEKVPMGPLYHGSNVDGGTFPAEIWGAYMKVATGGKCPPFPQPKEPFSASPFVGKYAGQAKRDPEEPEGAAPDAGTEEKPDRERRRGGNGGGNNGNGNGNGGNGDFDPDKYESEPQGPPDEEGGGTQAPGAVLSPDG
jgi:penicillin-binding protein 1A